MVNEVRLLRLLPLGGEAGFEIEVENYLTWNDVLLLIENFLLPSSSRVKFVTPFVGSDFVWDWLSRRQSPDIPVIHFTEDKGCDAATQTEHPVFLRKKNRCKNDDFPPMGVSRSKYLQIRSQLNHR